MWDCHHVIPDIVVKVGMLNLTAWRCRKIEAIPGEEKLKECKFVLSVVCKLFFYNIVLTKMAVDGVRVIRHRI